MTAKVTRAAIDTSALLAVASSRDQYHNRAVQIANRFRQRGGRWVGTTLVLAELHGHLLQRVGPDIARRVATSLLGDPIYEWHDATVQLTRAAIDRWIARYADQHFSLTDATTFELMRMHRIDHAFSFDGDFTTAGFQLLA